MHFEDHDFTVVQSLFIVTPAIVVNLILYFCSVRAGKEHSKKIIYRMLKIQINTCEENDAMYSTEEEDASDPTGYALALADSGNPYDVSAHKPYKPVFIVYLDILISITFVFISVMYFWTVIPIDDKVEHWG
jgi:hypothetical protein